MAQVAQQIAGQVVRPGVGQHHPADFDRLHIKREHLRPLRIGRRAGQNGPRHRQQPQHGIAVLILAPKGKLAEDPQETVFGPHLVLGFNAHIIDPFRQCIAEDDPFEAAPPQRFIRRADRVGVQIRQARIKADVHVYVRFEARCVIQVGLADPNARHRKVLRLKRDEGRVGEV